MFPINTNRSAAIAGEVATVGRTAAQNASKGNREGARALSRQWSGWGIVSNIVSTLGKAIVIGLYAQSGLGMLPRADAKPIEPYPRGSGLANFGIAPSEGDYLVVDFKMPPNSPGKRGILDNGLIKKAIRNNTEHEVFEVPDAGYVFPRNLAQRGKSKMILSGDIGDPHSRMAFQSAVMKRFFEKHNIPYRPLKNTANMANVLYDRDLDLLMIAHSPLPGGKSSCKNVPQFHPDCKDKTKELVTAFGKPQHVIQLVIDYTRTPASQALQSHTECYDLDLFLHLTTNRAGEKIALVYTPCIAQDAQPQEMGRENVLRQLSELGVEIIELGRDDFEHLAANSLTPEPGKMLFTDKISKGLKKELAEKGIEAVEPESPEEILGSTDYSFGLHCLTTELAAPNPKPEKKYKDEL